MKISEQKIEKISEQVLAYLFSRNPQSIFTAHIGREIARDEEFIKKILISLKKKKLVIEVKKNKEGLDYLRRSRWKLSTEAYNSYKQAQL